MIVRKKRGKTENQSAPTMSPVSNGNRIEDVRTLRVPSPIHAVTDQEDGNSSEFGIECSPILEAGIETSCDEKTRTPPKQFQTEEENTTHVIPGDDYINPRMKKYGMINVPEMKRKQQRRRCSRGQKPGNGSYSSLHEASEHSGLKDNSGGASSELPQMGKIPLHVQMAVDEIHLWLLREGAQCEDVRTLMTEYALYVREHFEIPLDRMFYDGSALHPKIPAYTWQWEYQEEFVFQENPMHVLADNNDSNIPPDTEKWFRNGNYKDYFALPDIYRGVLKGGLTWSTKCPNGFCQDDIQFFRMTNAALTTILRLHSNNLVLDILTDRMESEIKDHTSKLAVANYKIEKRTGELALANRKLKEANSEISRHASKQLEQFACMSHEIRTPLNCIVGLSSLLLEVEDLNDGLLDTINLVHNSAEMVQGVVNNVLDYARIKDGHFGLDVRQSNLQSILSVAVNSISKKLQEKNVKVRTSYCGKLSKTMTTDSRRLEQILLNLLGNAAKFSKEGTSVDFKIKVIEPASRTVGSGNNKNRKRKIRFSVKDYGQGIEEKHFQEIFQPFSQISKETQRIYGGTGLGLSITKALVTRLGGEISVKSNINKFTEFVVDLPYEEEPMDVTNLKEKLSETSIVILDPVKQLANASLSEEGDFAPFPDDLIRQYGLNVIRCSNWGDLEGKLCEKTNIRKIFVFLVHENAAERQKMLDVENIVSRDRCVWFTFGLNSSFRHQHKYHFETLTGIIPSILVDKICIGMATQEKSRCSITNVDGTSTVSDEEEQKTKNGESFTNRQAILDLFPEVEPSTRVRKKFATKYPSRGLKVLIVDNNIINQKVFNQILRRLGVDDISIVNHGEKAVALSESIQFDCIFMDIDAPIIGGLDACQKIVERDEKDARIVFVTAYDVEDIRKKIDIVGACGCITKPMQMKEIHDLLEKLKDLKSKNSKDFPAQPKATIASPKLRSMKKKRTTKKYPPRNLKILVAEDNVVNQKVLVRILTHLGVSDITLVDNGKKAVDASENTRFDCILMDWQMPVMDGLEACKIIVQRSEKKSGKDRQKIVFVTANALAEFKEKAFAVGGFEFITKPFKIEDIDNVLKVIETAKSGSPSLPAILSEPSPNINPKKIRKIG